MQRCLQLAHCCCACGCGCSDALRMDSPAARSHHAAEVRSACPALPSTGWHEQSALSHSMMLVALLLCGQLRAIGLVCRNSASSAADGLLHTPVDDISCARRASVSAAIPPLLLQPPLPLPLLPCHSRCSADRVAASTNSPPSNERRSSLCTTCAGHTKTYHRS